jgi:hypothetical protein
VSPDLDGPRETACGHRPSHPKAMRDDRGTDRSWHVIARDFASLGRAAGDRIGNPGSCTNSSGEPASAVDECSAAAWRSMPRARPIERGNPNVEPAGIEPATSCLQSRRSPN